MSVLDPTSLLHVLSGKGILVGVVGHYGTFDEHATFGDAVRAARAKLKAGGSYVRSTCVAIRIDARTIGGIGDGVERELARFEVYADRVALVPADQGGLSDEQRTKVLSVKALAGRTLL